jgi:hypothetical protein
MGQAVVALCFALGIILSIVTVRIRVEVAAQHGMHLPLNSASTKIY